MYLLGLHREGQWIWAVTTASVLVPTALSATRALLRRETNVDLIAMLAMIAAPAFGEFLAGAIVAVMLTSGSALERIAVARARRELSALLKRAPRIAHRRMGTEVVDIDVDAVRAGDVLLIKPGEVVPADGVLTSSSALLDESALSGESKPVQKQMSDQVRSGGMCISDILELRVTAPADESTYAAIIRLVRSAEESKAPFVRMADRYALGFLVVTIVLSTAAWLVSGDPVRALAVLVVATPCPLILAAPAAIMAGISGAARHGIIIKGGGPLETLARVSVLLLDKTGTVTTGRPEVVALETCGDMSSDELIRLAASIEQVSTHPYAPPIIAESQSRNVTLKLPTQSREEAGTGVVGTVDGQRIAVGQWSFVAPDAKDHPLHRNVERRTAVEGSSGVYVSVDGELVGAIILQDSIRTEAPRVVRALRKIGIRRIVLVTGDHPDVGELVGDAVGVDRVMAERTPDEKVDVVRMLRLQGVTAMVGDGINDAPALALADVGIAMGARGATAASEAADIVLTADRLAGLVHAVQIAQRTRRIARESVFVGMGLSVVAMSVAAAGYLGPVAGAILQEGIDLLVILNALRALGDGARIAPRPRGTEGLALQLSSAHRELRPHVSELATLAARLDTMPPSEARSQLEGIQDMLENQLLPHEREEQRAAFPIIDRMLQSEESTGALIQTHHEIHRLARLFSRLVEQLPPGGPQPADLRDLRRVLYGLHAVLSLHFAQEEDYFSVLQS